MVCAFCGTWNAEENQYCTNCGQRLGAPAPEYATPQMAPQAPLPMDFPDAVDGTPPPKPRRPSPARDALDAGKKARRQRRAKARRAHERLVVMLHFGATMLIVILCFVFMWYNLRVDRVLADWMDPNKPFYTFNLEREPRDFDAALREIGNSMYSTTPGLAKWSVPLKLRYEGSPSVDDIVTLNQIITDFNRIEGFPGITVVDGGENVLVAFPDSNREYWAYDAQFDGGMEELTSYCKRLVVSGVYQRAQVLITPKSESQNDRNSILLHELTHMLGFVGHIDDEESILAERPAVQGLSGTDLLSLQMVYNPDIPLGASYEALEAYYAEADMERFMPVWRTYLGPEAIGILGQDPAADSLSGSMADGSADGSDIDSQELLGQQADDE